MRYLPPRLTGLASLAAIIILPSAATTAAEPAALVLRTSFVHVDRATAQVLPVQGFDGLLSFAAVAHLHKTKAARAAGLAVGDHRHALDAAIRCKERLQIRFSSAEREVADK